MKLYRDARLEQRVSGAQIAEQERVHASQVAGTEL
jgi:hypothetical protein